MAGNLRLLAGVVALAGISAAGVFVAGTKLSHAPPTVRALASPAPASSLPQGAAPDDSPQDRGFAFHAPTGRPPSLPCNEARRVVRQARASLAYAPPAVTPVALATATADWLDPHGLWSVSSDSPVPAVLDREARQLLAEIEGADGAPCAASREVGDVLVRWVLELGARFDDARRAARSGRGAARGATLAAAVGDAVIEDDSRPARQLATTLGERSGRAERDLDAGITPYVEAARDRFFPRDDGAGWAGIVRAAAVRAYVQAMDPHGAWAPLDEEASVYDVDLDAHPPDRLWGDGVRTALGVRVESDPMDPLQVGDVVLSIAGTPTAGLPVEQLDQLVYATTDAPEAAQLVVLRSGEREVRTLALPAPSGAAAASDPPQILPAYRVPYGAGDALVVQIHDVRSDLGAELAATLRQQLSSDTRAVDGLLLDLRDDGGGSTEGAIAALSLFLPGAPLFPMGRRDGSIEVDRAPEPPLTDRWTRPVAALVDGDTASAAEMLAGALLSYRRGLVVGSRTYGKGCAQEYLDDDARAGVLRLTTLLYALPDGSPVQAVGIEPSILLPTRRRASSFAELAHEREADAPNAAPTWRGPDVRDPTLLPPASATAWPEPRGAVGPCRDVDVCGALQAIGAVTPGKRPTAAHSGAPPTPGRR